MILSLTNRFTPPSDGWIHLAPLGDFPIRHGEADLVQRVDALALRELVNSWTREGKRPLLLDYDHESHDESKRTEAAGWVEAIEARADGLWGKVRWSNRGETAVRSGDYRFVSPVWDVKTVAGKVVRPVRLRDAGLTNQPNLRGLTPLSNRGVAAPETQPKPSIMKKIALALGLAEEADEASCVTALKSLQNRAQEAETSRDALLKDLVNRDLDAAGLKTDDPARKSWESILLANRAEGAKALASLQAALGKSPAAAAAAGAESLRNRGGAPADPKTEKPALASRADEQSALIEEIRLKNRCGFQEAWNLAVRQKPELFRDPEEKTS